jgi:LmbE family N-acetylglucosaminyl deacetylase
MLLAGVLAAQQPAQPAGPYHLDDPANLAGERVSPQDPADTLPINHGAAALQQLLQKLRTRASFMLFVAHPDDEDGGLLTYLSRGQGARVAMLTLNRGEGGQNLMSADFDDALGLIRTQELLAADRYMGVDQFFGSVVDFGFSKTKEEAFAKWGHDRVLYDAVRAVRLYRPLVIASVFVGGPTDGHGQHQVAGEIAQEVFTAAADPKVFPEMGLPPWAPLKVYARTPFSRVDERGMYDSATGKYSPPRFVNYVTGAVSATPFPATVVIHEGDPATYLAADGTRAPIPGMNGLTYLQFAREGLALQKSQNGGAARGASAGAFDVSYARYASRINCPASLSGCPILGAAVSRQGGVSGASPTASPTPPPLESSLFDGIDTSLAGIASQAPDAKPELRAALEGIDKQIAEAQRLFDPAKPELTAPPLRVALGTLDELIRELEDPSIDDFSPEESYNLLHELRIKRVQTNNALVLAHGLMLDANLTSGPPLIARSPATVAEMLTNGRNYAIKFIDSGVSTATGKTSRLMSRGATTGAELPTQAAAKFTFRTLGSPADVPTRPYFSRPNIEQAFYDVSDPRLRNAPQTPAPLTAWATLDDEGVTLQVEATVRYPADPGKGESAAAIPLVSVSLSPSAGVIPLADKSLAVTARVESQAWGSSAVTLSSGAQPNSVPTEGMVRLEVPVGWRVEPNSAIWKLANPSDHADLRFSLTPPPLSAGAELNVTAIATLGEGAGSGNYREGFRAVGYPGLVYTNYYTPATFKAVAVDLVTAPNLRVAYLPGTGDDVPAYLPDLGVTPTMLTLADLTAAKLAQYDAVVLGVRAYAAHPELAGPGSQPLLDYARQGGVVIAQYNTARYGDADAPFPIAVPGSPDFNVVEEEDPVTLLAPDSPILTWPNRITPADFDHWIEERGHGFARSWSPEYTPLLEMHDSGQDPQRGGLLVARTGKGFYVYCALALYRQLPEGVPGAYRLFANLLSIAKNPALHTPTTLPAQ